MVLNAAIITLPQLQTYERERYIWKVLGADMPPVASLPKLGAPDKGPGKLSIPGLLPLPGRGELPSHHHPPPAPPPQQDMARCQ